MGDDMILIRAKDYDEILKHCIQTYPNEACGLLGGRIESYGKIIEKIYLMDNIDKSPEHFSVSAKEQSIVIRDMTINNNVMLGSFHSHTCSLSMPSREDIRLAYDIELSYFIVSLMQISKPVLKSFIIIDDLVREEEVKII